MDQDAFYVTTPLYYVNDELHLGHATATLYADTLARFKRLEGREVYFLTGSDEHGQKIFKAAQKAGVDPKTFADGIVGKFKELWDTLGVSELREVIGPDHYIFIRTTDSYHEQVVQSIFTRLKERDLIYKGKYTALYCTDCEQAYSPSNLVDGKCPIHKTTPTELDEQNYFFRLSRFTLPLRYALNDEQLSDDERQEAEEIIGELDVTLKPDANSVIPSSRRAEILGKLRTDGLEDVSVSRTAFDWGVRMPGDEKHVLWVWFDALINYVAATMRLEAEAAPEAIPPLDKLKASPLFQRLWTAKGEAKNAVCHVIGKDILWHHTVIWWSMLMGTGITPPGKVFAHGWWIAEGEKMSKTLGNVIRPAEIVEKYGRDAFRYYVLFEGPGKNDADWRQDRFLQTYNDHLAGGIGNLFSRVLTMTEKYCGGVVPKCPRNELIKSYQFFESPRQVEKQAGSALIDLIDACDFNGALQWIKLLVDHANSLIEKTQPFKLAKDPAKKEELEAVLHALLQALRTLAHLYGPFLPEASEKMKKMLGIPGEKATIEEACAWRADFAGTTVHKGESLFPRLEA